ncbi:UNVERIFIED_CONTAM: hypothetical protein PYX00_011847 [Menopon gallinae]|uniref:Transcription factor CBF/NF-Y/archaeal histone domain-containing protein n=1 Tax=Menopon gallinae TaxID=328185 RepID=A0AAW2H8N4_9NEOP
MTSYTVQLFEDGRALCDAGLVQIPDEFTCEDLSEYVQRLTGAHCKFNFYIRGKPFVDTLGHMVSVANYGLEDIVRIDYVIFHDSLSPDYTLEFPCSVTALCLSEDGEYVFVATCNRRFYKYNTSCGFTPVFEQEMGENVLCMVAGAQEVLGVSVSNKIWCLCTSKILYDGEDMPVTAFARASDGVLAVGFYDGSVKIQKEVVATLGSSVVYIRYMELAGRGLLWIATEAGHIAKYDIESRKHTATSVGTEITACCYFDGSLYLGTTEAKVIAMDTESGIRTLDSALYYVDWIFVNHRVCASSCSKTLQIQRPGDGTLHASAPHESQIVAVGGNDHMLGGLAPDHQESQNKPMAKDFMRKVDPELAQFSAPDVKEAVQNIKPKDIRTSNKEFWQRDDDMCTTTNRYLMEREDRGRPCCYTMEEYFKRKHMEADSEQLSTRSPMLPLARIKRLMKIEEDADHIASEVLFLYSKVTEAFIEVLTVKAWQITVADGRRIIQFMDLARAIRSADIYDFLLYIVSSN